MTRCRHTETCEGPRVPARWGSFATIICVCGKWTIDTRPQGRRKWRPIAELVRDIRAGNSDDI